MKLADGTEWRLVPRVATQEMVVASIKTRNCGGGAVDQWNSSLSAAPQPPVEELERVIVEVMCDEDYETAGWQNMSRDYQNWQLSVARAIVKRLMGGE